MKKNMKKNMLWMLLSLMAAAIMMPLSATAQTRIAVVSDIHVMAPDLLKNNAATQEPWITDYANERKMLVESAGLFDQFVTTMIAQKPNILLITGDLTKDGELASHDYVKEKLEALETEGIQVYVIPGNHDITTTTSTIYKYDGGTKTPLTDGEKMTTTAAFATLYHDYGYSVEDNNDPNGSLSYVADIADGLYLLAIDSHNSSVSEATLNWIIGKAQAARTANKRIIAMMHHPLFPHITGANMFIDTYAVKYQPTSGEATTYETVRNALINAGVNVILTGHFHTSDIAYDWDDDATVTNKGIYDINTGSLISYPCDYRMLTLTLSADKSTLSVKTKSLTPENWTAEECKSWLHDRMENVILQKFNIPMSNKGTQFAADLFILHAEGNENVSEDRAELGAQYQNYKTNTFYNVALNMLGIKDENVYSVLDDKSNYGNDHENQTADRAIVIDLSNPAPSNLQLELDNNDDNSSVINYYNGKEATVTLTGRTLFKDGKWNTICLPFDVTDGDADDSNVATGGTDGKTFTDTQLFDAVAKPLTSASITEDKGITTLNLEFGAAVTTIEAGRPYIIKWANTNETITDPKFTDVTIDNTPHIDGTTNVLTFRGTYAWQKFTDENKKILLIGKNNNKSMLYYPKPELTSPNLDFNAETNPWIYPSLGACRAYFQLADSYTAGVSIEGGGGTIRNFVLNFGDDDSATGIIAIGDSQLSTLNAQRSEWFTLDGRRLAAKPTAKGLYIHAGRKVVIK